MGLEGSISLVNLDELGACDTNGLNTNSKFQAGIAWNNIGNTGPKHNMNSSRGPEMAHVRGFTLGTNIEKNHGHRSPEGVTHPRPNGIVVQIFFCAEDRSTSRTTRSIRTWAVNSLFASSVKSLLTATSKRCKPSLVTWVTKHFIGIKNVLRQSIVMLR